MDWLKGLVPPAQIIPPGQALPPPVPGMPSYGQQQAPPYAPPPQDWQQQQAQQPAPQWTSPYAQPQAGSPDQQIAELKNNLESLALFCRTLLTMLEEKQIVTRPQFEETKRRLDMMDGKLDDK
jgi:hypothetical protein